MPGFHLRAQSKGKFRRIAVGRIRDVAVAFSLSLSFSSGGCNEVGGPVTGWYNTNRRTPSASNRHTYICNVCICAWFRRRWPRRRRKRNEQGSGKRVVKTEGTEGK